MESNPSSDLLAELFDEYSSWYLSSHRAKYQSLIADF